MALRLLLCLCVAGCAWPGSKIEYVPFEVQVPIAVPCAAELPTEPAWETARLKKADTLDDKARALLAERQQRAAYEAKLRAATDGCR